MEKSLYNSLIQYLTTLQFSEKLSQSRKLFIQKHSTRYFIQNNKLYYKNSRNNPKPLRVIQEDEKDIVLYNLHSDPTAGHFGIEGTTQKIAELYFWPKMQQDIRDYVKACDACQRRGGKRPTEPLHPLKVGQPFDRVGIDLVGPLPITKNGNRYIAVAIEYLTKWPEARAIKRADAKSVADFIYEDIICRHGCPKELLSDQGTHFVNKIVQNICDNFSIKRPLSSPYHPQTNGLVERFNRTLCESLAKIAFENEEE